MSKHPWIGKYLQMDGQWWRIDAVHENDIDVSRNGKVRIVPRSMMDGATLCTQAQIRDAEMEKMHAKQAADYQRRTGKQLAPEAAWSSSSKPVDYHAPSYEDALAKLRNYRDEGLVSDKDLNVLMSIYDYERLEEATPLEREQMIGDVKALIAQRRQRESYERLEAREAGEGPTAKSRYPAKETPQIIVH